MATIRQVAVKIGGDIAQLQRSFREGVGSAKNFQKSFDKVGGKMKDFGSDMSSKVSLPLAGLGGLAIATTAKFERSMDGVQSSLGGTGKEMDMLSKKAREMGSKTSKSASEAADAMGYMALAGWDVNQIMEATEPVLRLSEAGNIDLAYASDLVTDSMASLGLQTKDLNGYLDKLAQTSAKSNTNISMMMEAMNVVGGQFKLLNTPLSESNTLLGVLANRSIKGSEAGTSLNSILINLGSGAGQAGEAMKDIGLSAFDSAGKFKGITNVLRELNDKVEGMTEKKRFEVLSKIGGKVQIDTLNALLSGVNKTTGEYDQLYEKVSNSDGALNRMVKTMQGNLIGQLNILQSTLEELGIQFGTVMLPFFKKFVELVTSLASRFGKMPTKVKQIIIIFALIAAVIPPIIFGIGLLMTSLASIAGVVGAVSSGAVVLVGAFAIIGIAIGIVIGFFVIAYKKNEAFRTSINNLAISIKERFIQIGSVINKVKQFFINFWNDNKTPIQNFINKVIEVFTTLTNMFAALVSGDMQTFKSEVGNLFKDIKELWVIYSDELVPVMVEFWTIVGSKILEKLKDLKDGIDIIVEKIKTKVIEKIDKLTEEAIIYFEDLSKRAPIIFDLLAEKIDQKMADFMVELIEKVIELTTSFLSSLFGDSAEKEAEEKTKKVTSGITKKIKEEEPTIKNAIFKLVFSILRGLGKLAMEAPIIIGKFMLSIARSITNKAILITLVIAMNINNKIKNKLNELFSIAYSAGVKIINGILGGVDSKTRTLRNKISGIASMISGFFPRSPAKEGDLRSAPLWGAKIMEQLTGGMEKNKGSLKKTVDDITKMVKVDPINQDFNLLNETKTNEKLAIDDIRKNNNFNKTIEQLVLNITGNTIMNDNDIQNLTDKIGYSLKIAGM